MYKNKFETKERKNGKMINYHDEIQKNEQNDTNRLQITDRMELDFSTKYPNATVHAKQNDLHSRWIECTPLYQGEPFFIPEGVSAQISYRKPDRNIVFHPVEISEGKIFIELTPQMLVTAGIAKAEIILLNQEQMLSTAVFAVFVETGACDLGEIESSSEFQTLIGALQKALQITEDSEKLLNCMNEAFEKLPELEELAAQTQQAVTESQRATTDSRQATETALETIRQLNEQMRRYEAQIDSATNRVDQAAENAENAALFATQITAEMVEKMEDTLKELEPNQLLTRLEQIHGPDVTVTGSGWLREEGTREGKLKELEISGQTKVKKTDPEAEISPDTPTELSGIGESGTLRLVSCGKNLWNENGQTFPKTAGGVTVDYDSETGEYLLNGTVTVKGFLLAPKTAGCLFCQAEEGESYTLSVKVVSGSSSGENDLAFVAEFLNQENTELTPRGNLDCNIGGSRTDNSISKTIDREMAEQAKKVGFGIYLRNIGAVLKDYRVQVQFERGSKTDWEKASCQSMEIPLQTGLYSLPNGICDSIEKRGEEWGIVRRVGKGLFSQGTEIVKPSSDRFDTEDTHLFKLMLPMPNKKIGSNDLNLYLNLFPSKMIYDMGISEEGAYTTNGVWIRMKKSRVADLENETLLEWAKTGGGSNGIVLYETTERFEAFEESVQETLQHLQSQNGETNLILSETAPLKAGFYNHIRTATEQVVQQLEDFKEEVAKRAVTKTLSIETTAEKLQETINSLPKCLEAGVTIWVLPGSCLDRVITLNGFYGGTSLTIRAKEVPSSLEEERTVALKGIQIVGTQTPHLGIIGLGFEYTPSGKTEYGVQISQAVSGYIYLNQCHFRGKATSLPASGSAQGIYGHNNSPAYVYSSGCLFRYCNVGIQAGAGNMFSTYSNIYRNCTIGIHSYYGIVNMRNAETFENCTTNKQTGAGGLIVDGNGVILSQLQQEIEELKRQIAALALEKSNETEGIG